MSIENLLQNFANATGIIIDQTTNPPRTLGQAFLVSKSRVVTCGNCVFNYSEAPWALCVKFPHPNVVMGVKTIAIHPEFDRKEARTNYLSQTASARFNYPIQFNDLATMLLQPEIKDPDPESVMQLHRALSLPFSSEGVEASGTIKKGEFEEVVKKILDSKRQGLLTLFDQFNTPLAHIQIADQRIERVYYQGIVGEMAFAELIYRQPGSGFSFQPNRNFAWGDLRTIEMPAQDLLRESLKRAQELPAIFNSLGGVRARYQKVVKEFAVQSFDQNVQWLVSNLWQAIDGYMTIDQLSERVGADTYTVAQGLRELANRGVVSLINRESPFHMNGQLGTPIISHTDFDINPGDALKAFYLDPLSGAPCWLDGDFAGVSSVLQPKNLLHSIPIRLRVPGALIMKNYKLIGVHNGAVPMKSGQSTSERQLYQMMWIGALFDMGTKKLRAAAETAEGSDTEPGVSSSGSQISTLRVRGVEEIKPVVEKTETYICSTCYATNTQLGNCFNCGAVIDAKPAEAKKEGFFINTLPIKAVRDLQEKYQISDRKVFIAAGAFGLVVLMLIFASFGKTGTENQPVAPQVSQPENQNAAKAVQLAVNVLGFKGTAPPGYWFEDTSALTSPLPSFGLFSSSASQKIVFVIFNDMSPVQALDRFTQIPPFSDVVASVQSTEGVGKVIGKVTEGTQIIGENNFHYYVYNYPTANNSTKEMLVGSFPAKEAGKGVLVLGQAFNEKSDYDYRSSLFLIDTMAEGLTSAANAKKLSSSAGDAGTSNVLMLLILMLLIMWLYQLALEIKSRLA